MIDDNRRLAIARFCASGGLQSQAVILSWILYEHTKNPMTLAWIGLTEAGPAIFGAVIAGPLVDRVRPYQAYLAAYVFLMINFLFMSYLAHEPISAASEFLIFAGMFLSGAVRAFLGPSVFALLPEVAGAQSLPGVIAFHQSLLQIASVLAPAGAGLILGMNRVDAAAAATLALFIGGLFFILRLSPQVKNFRSRAPLRFTPGDLTLGFRYVIRHRTLLTALSLDLVSVLFGGAIGILPAFAREILNGSASTLGWLRAAPAAGAILMGVILTRRPLKKPDLPRLYAAVFGFGVSTVALGFSANFTAALVALFFSGFFDGLSSNIRHSLLQLLAPAHLRGRIGAVSQVFMTSSNEIGAFESGVAARVMGVSASIIFGGTMTLLTVGATSVALRSPQRSQPKKTLLGANFIGENDDRRVAVID